MPPVRAFLLSPARCQGKRADLLFNPAAQFALARKLRSAPGAELGEVFSFLSGLYFRGKLNYALTFAPRVEGICLCLVITPDRGLVLPGTHITLEDVRRMGEVSVDAKNPLYRDPLTRDTARLAEALPPEAEVVLLGSIAEDKYIEPIGGILGERLFVPADFVGRGDMSRGALMLRCARSGEELSYIPVDDARGQ
jgi:hypothetical protein